MSDQEKKAVKLSIGDVVVLKSGGPSMTVLGPSDMSSDTYRVAWFGYSSTMPSLAEFPREALQVLPEQETDHHKVGEESVSEKTDE